MSIFQKVEAIALSLGIIIDTDKGENSRVTAKVLKSDGSVVWVMGSVFDKVGVYRSQP